MRQMGLSALVLMLLGCGHFHRRAPVAPPEVSDRIEFPEWNQDASTTVTGPQLKALQIALDDFRPQGKSPPARADALTACLSRLDSYDAWVLRGEGMTFIHFTPKEDERCGLQPVLIDAGASYAISDDGVILKRE